MHHASQAKLSSSLQHDVLGLHLVSSEALEGISEFLLPSTQTYLELKAMGRTDMEDHDASHHSMYYFHIVAAISSDGSY